MRIQRFINRQPVEKGELYNMHIDSGECVEILSAVKSRINRRINDDNNRTLTKTVA